MKRFSGTWIALTACAFLACAFVACATTTHEEELGALRNDLAQVRATPDTSTQVNDLKPVGVLRGMTPQQIEAALGPPDCAAKAGKHCAADAAMEYDFYSQPSDTDGGGPTLLIFTDASAHCSDARWIFTE